MRMFAVKRLIDAGYANKLLMSHDIDNKYVIFSYGGHGYAHILENIVPTMLRMGVKQEDLDTILIENPKRLLTMA